MTFECRGEADYAGHEVADDTEDRRRGDARRGADALLAFGELV